MNFNHAVWLSRVNISHIFISLLSISMYPSQSQLQVSIYSFILLKNYYLFNFPLMFLFHSSLKFFFTHISVLFPFIALVLIFPLMHRRTFLLHFFYFFILINQLFLCIYIAVYVVQLYLPHKPWNFNLLKKVWDINDKRGYQSSKLCWVKNINLSKKIKF
jgi:hypothetical protein